MHKGICQIFWFEFYDDIVGGEHVRAYVSLLFYCNNPRKKLIETWKFK